MRCRSPSDVSRISAGDDSCVLSGLGCRCYFYETRRLYTDHDRCPLEIPLAHYLDIRANPLASWVVDTMGRE
jgi:hypothetical protein